MLMRYPFPKGATRFFYISASAVSEFREIPALNGGLGLLRKAIYIPSKSNIHASVSIPRALRGSIALFVELPSPPEGDYLTIDAAYVWLAGHTFPPAFQAGSASRYHHASDAANAAWVESPCTPPMAALFWLSHLRTSPKNGGGSNRRGCYKMSSAKGMTSH